MLTPTRSCRQTMGRMPASAIASIRGFCGKQKTQSTPSRFNASAIMAPPFIDPPPQSAAQVAVTLLQPRGARLPRRDSVSLDLDGEVAALEVALRGAGSPDRAVGEKAYLKSELDFFGTDLASIRGSAKAFKRAHAELTREELLGLVAALWMTSVFELRAVGVALLEQYTSLLV